MIPKQWETTAESSVRPCPCPCPCFISCRGRKNVPCHIRFMLVMELTWHVCQEKLFRMQHCGVVFCTMLEQALIDEDRMQIPLCAVTDKIYGDMGKRHDVACLSELHFWARPFLHDGFNEAIHIHHCHRMANHP